MRYLVFLKVPKKSMFPRILGVLSSDRPINFQDRLVVTASHTPRRRVKLACKRQVRVSSTESKYSYHNANLCYYSSVKFLLDIVLDVPVFAIFGLTKKSMFPRLLGILSSDRPINFQDHIVLTALHITRRKRIKYNIACI